MIIELQRQWVPDDPAYMQEGGTICAVCSLSFEEPSVVAWGRTDASEEMGVVCPECTAYLGRRCGDRFPSIGVYRELLEQYPEPMYPSAEALEAAAEAAGHEDPAELVYEASWVWRRPREDASA
jgi:hypothetical protein